MTQQMKKLCGSNDTNGKDICVLIKLCDIDPSHQLQSKADPSIVAEPPERTIIKLIQVCKFGYTAYKLGDDGYGVLAHGDIREMRKQFVEPLQQMLDSSCNVVQYAASFGIARRINGE